MVFRFVSLGLICLSWFRCGVFAFVAGLWLGFDFYCFGGFAIACLVFRL